MNNIEQNLGNSAAPLAPKRAHRGLKTSHAEFLRLWNDMSLTTEEIGRRLGIHQTNVCVRARSRGLPPRGQGVKRRVKDDALFREMWAAGVLIEDIARHFGVAKMTVRRTRWRLGLPQRQRGNTGTAITIEQFHHDRLARQMAQTAMQEQVMMLDVGMIERTNQVQTFMRIRRGAVLS